MPTSEKQPKERTVAFRSSGFPITDLALRLEFEAKNVRIRWEYPPGGPRVPFVSAGNYQGYSGVSKIMAFVNATA